MKKAPLFFKSAPDHPARASNTARGHRIPPRASWRSRNAPHQRGEI